MTGMRSTNSLDGRLEGQKLMKFMQTALRNAVIVLAFVVLYYPFALGQEKKVDAPPVKRAPLTVEEVETLVSGHVHPDRIVKIIRELGVGFPGHR